MVETPNVAGGATVIPERPAQPGQAPQASAGGQQAAAQAARPAIIIPPGLSQSGDAEQVASATDAVTAVLNNLTARFEAFSVSPPESGEELEGVLSDIKVAAPFLDRVVGAARQEIQLQNTDAQGALTPDGLAAAEALNAQLAATSTAVGAARTQFLDVLDGLGAEAPGADDAAFNAAVSAIIGGDVNLPAFSDEDVLEGRREFVDLVFEDIGDALARQQAAGANATV